MNNYEFCTRWILDQKRATDIRVLDYGCGAGKITEELKNNGVDAFGCDVFFDGGDCAPSVRSDLMGSAIKRMENFRIPFDSNHFDFVTNNQVMEHVEEMDLALSEIHRVLKPGGMVLSLFPYMGVWLEGHCGIPLLHWFPKGTRPRVHYAAMLRRLGVGNFQSDKSANSWAAFQCDWLDKWTYYRNMTEIRAAYGKYFADTQHIEAHWFRLRIGEKIPMAKYLPAIAQQLAVRKLAGLVFTSRKPG